MTPVMLLVKYRVHRESENDFLTKSPAVVSALRDRFPALLTQYLVRVQDDQWMDVGIWQSRDELTQAMPQFFAVPEFAAMAPYVFDPGEPEILTVHTHGASVISI